MSSITKNTFFILISRIAAKGISFILIIMLARYLGAEDYGKYALAFSFTNIFLYLADLGLGTLLVRESAKLKSKVDGYLANILSIKIFASVATFFLIVLIANILDYSKEIKTLIFISGATIIIQSFSGVFSSVFLGFQRMEYEGGLFFITQFLILISISFCVWKKISLSGIMWAFFLATAVSFIVVLSVENRKFIKIRVSFEKDTIFLLLRESMPFCITSFLTMITFNIDSVMLSKMLGFEYVGLYNSASKVIVLFGIIPVSIAITIFPYISEQWVKNKGRAINIYNSAIKYCLIFALPLAIGTTILAPQIILLLYGESYTGAVSALRWLAWVLPFLFLNNLLGRVLGAIGQQRKLIIVSLISATTNIVLNLILIPKLYIMGAALASISSYMVNYALQQLYIFKYFSNKFPLNKLLEIIVLSSIMGAVVYFVQVWNWIAAIVAGIIVFVVLVFIRRLVNFKELESLKLWRRK